MQIKEGRSKVYQCKKLKKVRTVEYCERGLDRLWVSRSRKTGAAREHEEQRYNFINIRKTVGIKMTMEGRKAKDTATELKRLKTVSTRAFDSTL